MLGVLTMYVVHDNLDWDFKVTHQFYYNSMKKN